MPCVKRVSPQTPKPHKHVPLRRCVVCRVSRPQAELIRFYKDDQQRWQLDKAHLLRHSPDGYRGPRPVKVGGRGAWVCQDPACHTPKQLKRFFKSQVDEINTLLRLLFPEDKPS